MVRRASSSEATAALPAPGKGPASVARVEKLPVPAADSLLVSGGRYTVQAGDTLGAIAERFGVSTSELLEANPHLTEPDGRPRTADGHWIYPGDIIKIPGPPVRDGASDTGATVRRLRRAQQQSAAALEGAASAPAPATARPVAGGPAPAPAPPVAAPPPPPPPAPPVAAPPPPPPAPPVAAPPPPPAPAPPRDGGWKAPQSDGSWRSPTTDGQTAPPAPAVWGGNEPQAGGPTYTPQIPLPPVYSPSPQGPNPPAGGYQSPRSDGDARYGTISGVPASQAPSARPTASGGLSKDQALIVGGVIAIVGLLGGSLIGTSTERAIGRAAAKEALQKYPLYTRDPRVTQYVQGVVDRLAANRERKDIQYEVKVVESNEPNAFALPGGYMFVTTAALKQMRNEAELAGVLGHEMAHVEKRHGIKKLQEQLVGMGIAVAALGQDESGNLAAAGGVALGLAMAGFSREHENESDRIGARLAAKAGYDPRGLVSFLQTIKAQEHPKVELLSDHPTTDKRIAAITEQIQKEGLLAGQMDTGQERYDAQVYWLRRGY